MTRNRGLCAAAVISGRREPRVPSDAEQLSLSIIKKQSFVRVIAFVVRSRVNYSRKQLQ